MVSYLAGPQGVEDEEELDEDAAEGEHSAHDDAGDGHSVHGLVWDLAGDLVGADRMLQTLKNNNRINKVNIQAVPKL